MPSALPLAHGIRRRHVRPRRSGLCPATCSAVRGARAAAAATTSPALRSHGGPTCQVSSCSSCQKERGAA